MFKWMLTIGCVLAAVTVQAAQPQDSVSQLRDPLCWEVMPEISFYRYKEPGVMEEDGVLFGAVGSYTRWTDMRYLKFEGRASGGEVDYDGELTDGTPYEIKNIDDFLIGVRVLMGTEWSSGTHPYRLYAGLGYRYLNDDASFDPAGYERESNYFYLPIGLWTSRELDGGWHMTVTGEFDLLLYGLQISHLEDVDPAWDTVENSQWPGFGGRASLEFARRVGRSELGFAPFIRYWWIDESELEYSEGLGAYIYEPRNNTLEYGISFVARF
jgi:hypothetical protein